MAKANNDVTPLMQQHRAIKQKFPDAILLFRVGDFYETFGPDAILASKILGITLTKRNNNKEKSAELAGFPHHALDTYLHKLVKAGYRVAICDQLEDPKFAKGIVKRGVTDLVTPGTAITDKLLDHQSNNYLASIYFAGENLFGLSFIDITTGEFFCAEGDADFADKLLQSFKPAELIYQRTNQKKLSDLFNYTSFSYALDDWVFSFSYSSDLLLKQFQTHSLKGFGIDALDNGIIAAGAILHYLKETEHANLNHINQIQLLARNEFLWMDKFTIRNLELFPSQHQEVSTNLFGTLNFTVSPMGARLLKRWITFPLIHIDKINERLNTVEFLIQEPNQRKILAHEISQCGDIERLVSKIPLKKTNPKELLNLANGLIHTQKIKTICFQSQNFHLKNLGEKLNHCSSISEKILKTIHENAPALAAKGGFIKANINSTIDELRELANHGKSYLIQIQKREAARTGIQTLKIGFNHVFGYYLEVTQSNKDKAPADWIRKQTLVNAERYITTELKEYEEKITGAEDKILQLELQLYENLLEELLPYIKPILLNAHILSQIDCLLCFAENAIKFSYHKPELHLGDELELIQARHPVIERCLPQGEMYISNDVFIDKTQQQIIILTGPNMSGKSALLRQTALIVLMAHMGSFVPASSAKIPLTDKIFTRVGANDNLSSGESTFMVEMNETASILNNLSEKSLVLLDEIGRGTSTYDGISIAWSIIEFLYDHPFQPKTLFATHYHELNELEQKYSRIKNFHITHKEADNKIVFLRKLAKGGSMHSFGIHVAKKAGMPLSLTSRANEILEQLENREKNNEIINPASTLKKLKKADIQLSIFDAQSDIFLEIRNLLKDIDINRLTPVEALLKLQEIKIKINKN